MGVKRTKKPSDAPHAPLSEINEQARRTARLFVLIA